MSSQQPPGTSPQSLLTVRRWSENEVADAPVVDTHLAAKVWVACRHVFVAGEETRLAHHAYIVVHARALPACPNEAETIALGLHEPAFFGSLPYVSTTM